MKKIISLILALAMIMALAVTATAVDIQITAPENNGDIGDLTYTAYKVFSASVSQDGTQATYTIKQNGPFWDVVSGSKLFARDLVPGTTDEYVVTYSNGNIADPILTLLGSSQAKGTGLTATYSEADGKFIIEDVEEGYYYIESSFGTGIILDTVGKSTITVEPKNELPTLSKKIVAPDGSLVDTITADAGETITFRLTYTIPATAKVGEGISLNDEIGTGLYFDAIGTSTNPNFDINEDYNGTDNVYNWWLGSVRITSDMLGKTYTLDYTATVGLTEGENAAIIGGNGSKNRAYLDYGLYRTEDEEVTVFTYTVDVYKYANGSPASPLAGAGFKLKNADGLYYTNTNGVVTWTATGTEYFTTTENGCTVEFIGVANGTYTLVESTVPAGYNKAADQTVTVNNASFDNADNKQIMVNNNSGSELPSTGGIGTTLFYVFGSMMMLGAAVLLITKRRVA